MTEKLKNISEGIEEIKKMIEQASIEGRKTKGLEAVLSQLIVLKCELEQKLKEELVKDLLITLS